MSLDRSLARLLTLLTLSLSVISIWFWPVDATQQLLKVYFLDVGQGDSVLIESPTGTQMLVDGGPGGAVLRKLAAEMGFFDRSLDYVVATHPDSDHISGLVDVLARYEVGEVWLNDKESDTDTYKAFIKAVQAEAAMMVGPRRGRTLDLGEGVVVEVLWPEGSVAKMESNTGSIVLRVSFGETSFLLTGDSPKNIEEYLVLTEGEYLKSTVLKVGHHGSRTSTSELFLSEVNPEYAVVSAGANNRYGHPHVEVTDILFNYGVETISTTEVGTVTFMSDGTKVWLE